MLKFIAISGTTGVTENLYVYEYGNDMIVVDCGVGFPESEMYGVDLVIPDFTYIRENRSKLRGVIISHGHEDHMGALPFLLKEIDTTVHATKLVSGFIEDKLADYKMKGKKVKIFDPDRDELTLGVFRITPFRVSHSVPDGVGFAIDTPEGRVFHVPDSKFDWTPVNQKPFDISKLALLASRGCLALASDCLGSTTPGYTESERQIEDRLEHVLEGAVGQVFFTTISSNISRMQQAINVAQKHDRVVTFIGRSIEKKAEIAKKLGYLQYPDNVVVPSRRLSGITPQKIMYIISGSYGQPGSALDRVSLKEHDRVAVTEGDIVIFSSDPAPPGSRENVDAVVDRLIELGADVHYYDLQEDLHVSGHGSQEDIKMLFALASPKYFIPIGGTIRRMRAYSRLAENMGAKPEEVFELKAGETIEFSNKNAKKGGKVSAKSIMVDALGIGDVGHVVLRDRQTLAADGIVITMVKFDRNNKEVAGTELISRGFIFEGKYKGMLTTAGKGLAVSLAHKKMLDEKIIRDTCVDFLERFFFEETGRRPMILPVIVEV